MQAMRRDNFIDKKQGVPVERPVWKIPYVL